MGDALGDSETKQTISEALTSLALPKAAEDSPSKLASFGITIGLTMLGEYLATMKRESGTARARVTISFSLLLGD